MKESSVCGIIVNSEILLLKRRYKEGKSNGWCLPGGKMEPGETNFETAIRETFEETGIQINTPEFVCKTVSHSKEFTVSVFYTSLFKKPDNITLSEREHTEYAWVNLNELNKYELAGNTISFINSIIEELSFI